MPASMATDRMVTACSPVSAAARSRASMIWARRSSWSTSFGIGFPPNVFMVQTYHQVLLFRVSGGTMTRTSVGRFVSEEARGKFLEAYDRAMELWPSPREELDVETGYGTVHVHRYGART